MVFEYNDTVSVKNWEGKIQKLDQEELTEWGGLVCPISFLPATPKYLRKDNEIRISLSNIGKSYPFKYPYSYGLSMIENNLIDNTYFDDIPLRIFVYGKVSNPEIGLVEISDEGENQYSSIRFENLIVREGEHLLIDAIRSKVLLWQNGAYRSVYDYVSKSSRLNTFLFARGNTVSKLLMRLNPQENGYLIASYRQYTL